MSIACEPLVAIWLSTSTTESSICCKQVAEKHHGEHLKIYVCSKGGGACALKYVIIFAVFLLSYKKFSKLPTKGEIGSGVGGSDPSHKSALSTP